jgi:hypothetical protein
MDSNTNNTVIPDEFITSKIYVIRDKKVILNEDHADLYNVITGNFNKAIKRNITRCPERRTKLAPVENSYFGIIHYICELEI